MRENTFEIMRIPCIHPIASKLFSPISLDHIELPNLCGTLHGGLELSRILIDEGQSDKVSMESWMTSTRKDSRRTSTRVRCGRADLTVTRFRSPGRVNLK